jgi:transposase InsO family protein
VKYAFIERHRRVWPISVQCRMLKVSVSGFHQHLARRRKIASRRHLSDATLLAHNSAVYAEFRGAYGWPRIWRELVKRGIRVGKQRVQRLMQKNGIRARSCGLPRGSLLHHIPGQGLSTAKSQSGILMNVHSVPPKILVARHNQLLRFHSNGQPLERSQATQVVPWRLPWLSMIRPM